MWLLLNSAGRCSAICDQTGVEPAPERRTTEAVVGVLQLVGGRRVPPDHQVGVGAQAGDVVDAADRRRRRRPSSANSFSTSAASAGAVGRRRATSREPEHRPHRVADRVVEVLARPCAAAALGSVMALIAARGARRRRPHLGRPRAPPRRCRPGCRPRRTPRRRPRARARPRPPARMPRDPVEVADGVLRQRAAPPLDVRVDRAAPTARSRRRGRPAPAATSSSSETWSGCLLAVPAERAAHHQQRRRPPRRRAHPVPLGEGERRGLDRALRPPAAPGSPTPTVAREVARAEGQRDDRHRGVLDPRPAQRPRPAPRRTAAGRSARAGRGQHHRVGVQHLAASCVEPDHEVQPPSAGAGQLADGRRRCGPRTRRRPRPRRAAGRARRPARRTPGTSEAGAAAPRRRPASASRSRSSSATTCGHGGPRGDLAGVAGVHPAEQRLDQPVDDLAAEPLLDQPADADVLAVERGWAAAPAPGATRARPGSETHAAVGERPRSVGTPIRVRGMRPQRAARPQVRAESVAGCTSASPRPTSRASVDRLGTAVEHRLGADVDGDPADLGAGELAADGAEASSSTTSTCGAVRRTAAAAARPAMPPPTTTTRGGGVGPVRAGVTPPDSQGPGHRGQPEGTGSRCTASQSRQPGAAAPRTIGAPP